MSFRMSKSVVLFAFVLMALPVLAFAQTSRLEGMTLQGDYVKDYTNIYGYPSQVANVGNLAYGELGNTFGVGTGVVDRGFGSVIGNLMEGRTGAWAIHLRELSPQLGTGDNSSVNSADPNFNMNEEFDLMWAKKAGTTSFGLRLNRSFWGSTVSPPSPGVQTKLKFDPTAGATAADSNARNLSRNTYGFGGGVGFEMNPNTSVEIGLLYQSRTFESTGNVATPGVTEKEDKPTSFLLSGRAMWQWQSNIMVTPMFKWYTYDLSRKVSSPSGTRSSENTLKGWQIGAAANWSLGSNDMLVWGLDFIQNKVDQTDALFGTPGVGGGPGIGAAANSTITENIAPRLFAALETHVNPWLTVRMGASKGAFTKFKTQSKVSGGTITETTAATFDMNIGAGVKLGTLQLDAVLANNAFQFSNGLLGGTSPTGGFFPKVSATYSF